MPVKVAEPKSKSQKKREHQGLQSLAESLIGMPAGELAAIPMSDGLRENILEATRMKKRAWRRQVRYLARLLSQEDDATIRAVLDRAQGARREDTSRFHRIERWRDRLISNQAGSFVEFLETHPDADPQQLRQLVRAVRRERERNGPPRAFRRLFELIRRLEA